ncbi:hypothetical protein AMST5_00477 [freshwater sediment metagenome]|jgi:hypothetical protein|uniref:Uncharacterized protein n=1 Tax=freshwater sediment metagenome TaxID=556182 RepID=A0AA48M0E0_9ZZZZ
MAGFAVKKCDCAGCCSKTPTTPSARLLSTLRRTRRHTRLARGVAAFEPPPHFAKTPFFGAGP